MSKANVKVELFEQFARIGKALGSAKRLELLDFIAQADRSVEVLARMTGLSVANPSQHLQLLRQAGLVDARKEGLYVYYSLAGDSIVRLLAALRAVGQERLAEVDKLVRLYLDSKDGLEPGEEGAGHGARRAATGGVCGRAHPRRDQRAGNRAQETIEGHSAGTGNRRLLPRPVLPVGVRGGCGIA